MRKINYPNDTDDFNKFKNDYFDAISDKIEYQYEICIELKKIDKSWDLRKLLVADFNELITFSTEINSKKSNLNALNGYFKSEDVNNKIKYLYSDLQRSIADFFIEKKVIIKTCHYCNIDFINPFNQFIEYKSIKDFFRTATENEWKELLTEKKGKKIYDYIKANPNCKEDEVKKLDGIGNKTFTKITLQNINNLLNFKDHFTLDHILPKGKYPYFSLSIYNLIPSCYSCNSKFKGQKEFENLDFIGKISPSSKTFELDKLLEFKLNFDVNTKDLDEKINHVKEINDINVELQNIKSEKDIDTFLDMFALKGRYNFHKYIALEMIKKRQKYSDTQIKEIAKMLSVSENQVKEDIFGKELYDETNAPFEKYKNDIGKELGLI